MDIKEIKDRILDATDNGLRIFEWLCSGYNRSKPKQLFIEKLIHDESTPSLGIKQHRDTGRYFLHNFATGENFNAFDLYMKLKGISQDNFIQAIKELCVFANVEFESGKPTNRSAVYKPLKPNKASKEGKSVKLKEEGFTIQDLMVFNKRVENDGTLRAQLIDALELYDISSIHSYTIIKNDGGEMKGHEYSSTDNYPIFQVDYGVWKKIYKPYELEKKHRFLILGEKPDRVLNGLRQAKEALDDLRKTQTEKGFANAHKAKLPAIIICCGEKDAINIRLAGYWPIWLNSESDMIDHNQWHELTEISEVQYYCGDIDDTGIKKAIENGLKHLDLHLIRLPQELRLKRDWRGRPCKDVADWMGYNHPAAFSDLVRTACPMRFWEWVESSKGSTVKFNPAFAMHFLECHGFYRLMNQNNVDDVSLDQVGYTTIRVTGHIVEKIGSVELKNFLIDFARARHLHLDILNLLYRTKIVTDQLAHSLPIFKGSFERSDAETQYWPFANKLIEIKASGIRELKPGSLDFYVWKHHIISPKGIKDFDFKLLPPLFKAAKTEKGYSLEILDDKSTPVQFAIHTSRVHWKKEFDRAGVPFYESKQFYDSKGLNRIDGEHLTEDEKQEQRLHFLNKVTAWGYLMHQFTTASKPWTVWVGDNVKRDIGDSQGGSGKSIFVKFIKGDTHRLCYDMVNVDGKDTELTKDKYLFAQVTNTTDVFWIEDANEYFNFERFFTATTSFITVRDMHKKQYTIPLPECPKLVVTTNHMRLKRDSSHMRRLKHVSLSDFFHSPSSINKGERKINQYLGEMLFDDWTTAEQFNVFYNFMIQCIQTGLDIGFVDPPMDNIDKLTLLSNMGTTFLSWANEYFQDKIKVVPKAAGEHPDDHVPDRAYYIPLTSAREDYNKGRSGNKRIETQAFHKKIQQWCEYMEYTLNPKKCPSGSDGRCMVKMSDQHAAMYEVQIGSAVNCIYILAHKSIAEMQELTQDLAQLESGEELPF